MLARRGFLAQSAAAGLAVPCFPLVASAKGAASATSRLTVAAIGVGGRGAGIGNQLAQLGNMIACCDVHRGNAELRRLYRQRQDSRGQRGGSRPRGERLPPRQDLIAVGPQGAVRPAHGDFPADAEANGLRKRARRAAYDFTV